MGSSISAMMKGLARRGGLMLCASVALFASAAQDYRPAPKFEGTMIPEPPSQGQPWTAPPTKLPRFLVDATGFLFEQGVPDPRACEYRSVEIGDGSIAHARGFVFPERADVPGRFVICWDGLVYPALSVGDPADLEKDINGLVASLQRSRTVEKSRQFGDVPYFGFPGDAQHPHGVAGVDNRSPLKLCM